VKDEEGVKKGRERLLRNTARWVGFVVAGKEVLGDPGRKKLGFFNF